MLLKPEIIQDVAQATPYLTEGRIIAFPTGTSYGLAVDALQGHALQRLRNLKGRPAEKTFTVFVRPPLVSHFFTLTPSEQVIIDTFTGQSLTLLLTPNEKLAHLAQDGYVGLRFIDHLLMKKLAEAVDIPLTATSANKSGEEPAYSPADIQQQFPYEVAPQAFDLSLAAILDSGTLSRTKPSTIAKVENGDIAIIRPGSVSADDLRKALS